ncbi:hypothetical protein [Alcanivorax sp.]|uniref:hypothetical protein n=1 Tax=Alcanivorax sp. TaxID=1872427 RepID=UPI003A8EE214
MSSVAEKIYENSSWREGAPTSLEDRQMTMHLCLNKSASTNDIICHVFFIGEQGNSTSARIDTIASEPLLKRIASFKHLQPNWEGYEGTPPSHGAIEDAITFVKTLENSTLPTRIGVSNDGEICLIWEREGLFADLGMTGDGHYSYFIKYKNDKFYGDEISLSEGLPSEALDFLRQ